MATRWWGAIAVTTNDRNFLISMLNKILHRACATVCIVAAIAANAAELELKSKKVAVIPFQMRAGYPFVDIEVAGVKHNLLVDMTDYRQITLASEVLEKTPHKLIKTEKYAGANDKVFFLKQFTLEEVTLGGLKKRLVQGTEEAVDPDYPTPSPAGAIGAGLFFDDVLTMDFHNSQFVVNTAGALDRCEPLAAMGLPLVAVLKLDDKELTFLLDIAYQYSVIDANVANNLMGLPAKKDRQSREMLIKDLHFDHFEISNVVLYPLSMAGSGLHGVIGMDVFRRYNLAIDFNNNCFDLPLATPTKMNLSPLRLPELR
jgi:hypothetical protein